MKTMIILLSLCLRLILVYANGLVGYGIYPYSPYCAFSCLRALDSFALGCSSDMVASGGHSMSMVTTTPQCRAGDSPWLTSLAYCVRDRCADAGLLTSELEKFWEQQSTEDPSVAPKWGYTATLEQIQVPPNETFTDPSETLNATVLVDPETYQLQFNALSAVQDEVAVESTYGIVLLVAGIGIPLAATWASYLPFIGAALENLKPSLVYPSLIGTYHSRPLPYALGNAPTRGQSWYIGIFIALNIILSAVDYHSKQPHAWYTDREFEIAAYVAYRTGVYALVMVPLMILFSSRNNFLLWLTNWSYSTFNLLHRWIARLFVVYSLVHTLVFVALWCINGSYGRDSQTSWWRWGVAAMVLACCLLISSAYWVRRNSYEVFLLLHIIMAALVLVGMYYHVVLWLPSWGWQNWIFTAVAVWVFDRAARLMRVASNGLRLCKVTSIGEEYFRIDIDGIHWSAKPGRHAFCYFPTLARWKAWENHPFSIVPTALMNENVTINAHKKDGEDGALKNTNEDQQRLNHDNLGSFQDDAARSGITLFVKKATGMTRLLRPANALLALVEGPYPSNSVSSCLRCDRVVLIAGGIGITGLVTWIPHHPNVKLAWSMKYSAECLVHAFKPVLSRLNEKEIRIGTRLDVEGLLREESRAGWDKVGIVVSGPPAMCDVVRAAVARLAGDSETRFELEVDSFSF